MRSDCRITRQQRHIECLAHPPRATGSKTPSDANAYSKTILSCRPGSTVGIFMIPTSCVSAWLPCAHGSRIDGRFGQRKFACVHCRKFGRSTFWPQLCRDKARIYPVKRLPVCDQCGCFAVSQSEQMLRRHGIPTGSRQIVIRQACQTIVWPPRIIFRPSFEILNGKAK